MFDHFKDFHFRLNHVFFTFAFRSINDFDGIFRPGFLFNPNFDFGESTAAKRVRNGVRVG
jgi:hypothetical protein